VSLRLTNFSACINCFQYFLDLESSGKVDPNIAGRIQQKPEIRRSEIS
jgi:hypothetical protein